MTETSMVDVHAELLKLTHLLHDRGQEMGLTSEQLSLLANALRAFASPGSEESACSAIASTQSEQRYRTLFERSPDGIFAVDPHGRFIEANPACEAITGYSRAELLDMTFMQLCAPDRLASTVDNFRRTLGGDSDDMETALIHKDGRRVELLITGGPIIINGSVQEVQCAAKDVTERKRAEQALRESEERLRMATESAGLGTWELNALNGSLSWSESCKALFAIPSEQAMTYDLFLSRVHPEDRQRVSAACLSALAPAGTGVFEQEFRAVWPDGTVRWIAAKGRAHFGIIDGERRVLRSLGTAMDVTERNASEQAMRESEQRFRFLSESIPHMVWSARPDGCIDYFNCRVLEYTGAEHDRLLGWDWLTFIHPDDHAATTERWTAALQDGNEYKTDFRIRHGRTGLYRWHRAHALPMRNVREQIIRWYGTCTDTDQRRRAEEALRASEARLNRAQEIAHLGSWELDVLANRLAWSDEVYRIFGLEPQAFAATYEAFLDITHPDDRAAVDASYTRSLREGCDTYEIEHRVVRKSDGQVRFVHEKCEHIRDASGRVVRSVGMVHDITERKRQEEELAHAKAAAEAASRAKDQFIAILSHELRTPLTPVLTTAQMLERDSSLSPEHREAMSLIRRNVDLEARLIDDLLDLTRIARGKLELRTVDVDVHRKISSVVKMVEHEATDKHLTLNVDAQAAQHHVMGDTARLHQVLWNLLRNAVKFTPPGGQITVRTHNPAPDRVVVTVEDSGIGIERHVLSRIFDAFEQGGRNVTRQFGGLGLGLTISKGLIDLHGGTLTAHSDGCGRGTTFTVELRTTSAAVTVASGMATAPHSTTDGAGRRILLVEDHADSAKTMRLLLMSLGFDVVVADCVRAALCAAEAQQFDLIISDIGLPDGSGVELMRQLRAKRPTRGIALSGYGMEEDVRKSREAGFEFHLTKPVNLPQLEEAIRKIIS